MALDRALTAPAPSTPVLLVTVPPDPVSPSCLHRLQCRFPHGLEDPTVRCQLVTRFGAQYSFLELFAQVNLHKGKVL